MAVVSMKKCPKCGTEADDVAVSSPRDLRPAFRNDVDLIRRLVDEKYGEGCGLDLIPDDRTVILNDNARGSDSIEIIIDGDVIGMMIFRYDMKWHIELYLPGFVKISPHLKGRIVTANHSGTFMLKNRKNLMVSGVKYCDPDLKIGDRVMVRSEKNELIGTGLVSMSHSELKEQERGMFVRMKEWNVAGSCHNGPPINWKDTIQWNKPRIEEMVKEAIAFMRKMIKDYPDLPYAISFSGGKDSQVIVMLCVDAKLKPKVIFADTGLEYPETVEFVKSYIERHDLELITAEASFESFLKNMKTFGPPAEGYRWCCKTNKLSAIATVESKMFPNGSIQFVGQRRYESMSRMRKGRIVRNPWMINQITAMPVQEWNALHVWMYILMRDEPFNPKYEKGMPRIGCMLCPFMSLSEIEMNRGTSEKFERWYQGIADYGKSRGMPEEWMKYHLWRYRELPMSVYEQIAPLCGKSYEELTKRTLPPERPPLKMKMQEGYSPCVMGYSVEAALTRPVDIDRLAKFAKILGKDVKLEEGMYVSIGDLTVYTEGVIISKGKDLENVKESIRTVFEILIKSEECCGCRQCTSRCPTGAIKLVNEKVEMDPSKCVSCRKCLCPCPSVKYSAD
jgi:phosphoadenosine phosphosulfate reductase